jgi:hypothetical protein
MQQHLVVREQGGCNSCTLNPADTQVLPLINSWAARHPSTRVLLLPSTRDIHHAPVFPTPPFTLPGGFANSSTTTVESLPSPCLFEAAAPTTSAASTTQAGTSNGNKSVQGGLVFGATCVDVIKALSASELCRGGPQGADRLAALAGHVVGQRR